MSYPTTPSLLLLLHQLMRKGSHFHQRPVHLTLSATACQHQPRPHGADRREIGDKNQAGYSARNLRWDKTHCVVHATIVSGGAVPFMRHSSDLTSCLSHEKDRQWVLRLRSISRDGIPFPSLPFPFHSFSPSWSELSWAELGSFILAPLPRHTPLDVDDVDDGAVRHSQPALLCFALSHSSSFSSSSSFTFVLLQPCCCCSYYSLLCFALLSTLVVVDVSVLALP